MAYRQIFGKKAICFLISILGLILCGQFVAQLYTVKQLNNISGEIADVDVQTTSYSGGGRFRSGTPNYSEVLTLTNGKLYYFDLSNDDWANLALLKKGEKVTIYYPTRLYDILSLNILEFGKKGCQIMIDNFVVYSFDKQKKAAWPFAGFIIAFIVVGFYRLYGLYHGG